MSEAYELYERIRHYLELRAVVGLKTYLLEQNPVDIAEAFAELEEKEFSLCFRLLTKELATEVFVNMESDRQKLLIDGLSDAKLKELMEEICPDDAVDLVEEMPAGVVSRILKHTDPEMREAINAILLYPKNSVLNGRMISHKPCAITQGLRL